jgi:hypothetical protein
LKKYGSKEGLLKAKKEAYKKHYNTYGKCTGGVVSERSIQYVRYGEIFLIGIEGDLNFVKQLLKDINNFIKSNLHIEIKKNNIVQHNVGIVQFLGYNIELQDYKRKIDEDLKIIRAFKEHKKKAIVRFKEVEKYLAKVRTQQIRINVLKQVNAVSRVFKLSLKPKRSLSCIIEKIIAYREIGCVLMKILKIKDYSKFLMLIEETKNIELVKDDNLACIR